MPADPTLERTPQKDPVVLLLGALAILGQLLVAWIAVHQGYGFHRDELYYMTGGLRLDFGYVDHPPLVPWLAGLSHKVFGPSVVGLRLWPALVAGLLVVLTAILANRLGASQRGHRIAALATASCLIFVITQGMFQVNPFDQVIWLLAIILLTAVLDAEPGSRSARSAWLLLGGVLGVGLLIKYTVAGFGLAILLAFVLTSARKHLVTPWPWLAGLLAMVVFSPNLWWLIRHDVPFVEFASYKVTTRSEFLGLQLPFLGLFWLPLLFFAASWWKRHHRHRPLAIAGVITFFLFLVLAGKPYYVAPLYPLVFAAGGAAVGRWGNDPKRAAGTSRALVPAVIAAAVANLAVASFFLPLIPVEDWPARQSKVPNNDVAEMVGWPELAAQVDEQLRALEGEIEVVLASNYGNAAAIELFGKQAARVTSPHNSYWFWSRDAALDAALVVGYSRQAVERYWRRWRRVGVISNPWGVDNDEAGAPLFVVYEPLQPSAAIWDDLRRYR